MVHTEISNAYQERDLFILEEACFISESTVTNSFNAKKDLRLPTKMFFVEPGSRGNRGQSLDHSQDHWWPEQQCVSQTPQQIDCVG